MKIISFGVCFLIMAWLGSANAQGIFRSSTPFGKGGYWELGSISMVQPRNSGTFYSSTRNWGSDVLRTDLLRESSFVQRSYLRWNTLLSERWILYGMADVSIQRFEYGSRDYFTDGTLYRIDRFNDNGPSRSLQQSLSLGAVYLHPIQERLSVRAGGGMGLMMGMFEEGLPLVSNAFSLIPNWTASVRLTGSVEAGIDYQLSKQKHRAHLLVSYVLHHAFANNDQILNHFLPTHHGLQIGFRFGIPAAKKAQTRSDILGF